MLKSLTLKNFRQHTDRTFEFTDGLNVIRGANEAGKSGLLEGIQYAMFGVKFCREGIADMVTWGCLEATLAVTLVFEIENVTYTIYRNKAGAELRYEGGHVTGQNEVGLFVARLLGVPLTAVSKLMMATQKDIRGTIDGGDTDAAKLIETLANLKVLDDLQDIIKGSLPCGADVAPQSRLQSAKADLATLEASAEGVDTTAIAARQQELTTLIPILDAAVKRYEAEAEPLGIEFGEMMTIKQKYQAWANKADLLKGNRDDLLTKRDQVVVPPCPDNGEIVLAQAALDAAKESTANLVIIAAMNALNDRLHPDVWDGTFEDFAAAYSDSLKVEATARSDMAAYSSEVRLLESRLVTGSVCGYCAKDVSSLPDVAAKNAELTAAILGYKAQASAAQIVIAGAASEKKIYAAIAAADAIGEKFATANAKFVRLLDTQVPRLLQWVGPDVGSGSVSVPEAEALLANLRAQTLKHSQAAGQVSTFTSLHEAKVAEIELHHSAMPAAPAHDVAFDELSIEIARIAAARLDASSQSSLARAELVNVNIELAGIVSAEKMLALRKSTLQETIDNSEKEIRDLAFNNQLVKRVREVRPLVANHLWSKVLSAVSHYFSQMRGSASVVAKTDGGFRIDGHNLKGMSGSTLDALGLAVRLALTKTFTPHVSMLVIDEPFAAMDEARTLTSLGFIAGCGFKQILLVTHEEASTANADNLITL